MHLVSCATPQEPLEDAPRSALLADRAEGDAWDGFWSQSSDAYYLRRTTADGSIEWYSVSDDGEPAHASEPRVLTLRTPARPHARVHVVVAQSPAGRRMLVGSAGRSHR